MRADVYARSVSACLKARRAISRLTGSKLDRVTASGVSSIIRSTPVACSSALIFRPSLPIVCPSFRHWGSLPLTLCSPRPPRKHSAELPVKEFPGLFHSLFVSEIVPTHANLRASLLLYFNLHRVKKICLASAVDRPAIVSICFNSLFFTSVILARRASISFSLFARFRSLFSNDSSLLSTASFFLRQTVFQPLKFDPSLLGFVFCRYACFLRFLFCFCDYIFSPRFWLLFLYDISCVRFDGCLSP